MLAKYKYRHNITGFLLNLLRFAVHNLKFIEAPEG